MKELWKRGIEQWVIRESNLGVSCRLQSNMFLEESFGEFQEVRYQEIANRNIFKFMNHMETATAGSSMISNVSDEDGIPSPASIISSI